MGKFGCHEVRIRLDVVVAVGVELVVYLVTKMIEASISVHGTNYIYVIFLHTNILYRQFRMFVEVRIGR